jgi:hypothetical protein
VAYGVLTHAGMESQWKKVGRPALMGFVLGLFVTTGLAYIAPLAGLGVRTHSPVR